ncbi:hypothetical protein V8C44DRAFT_110717 [Trichoderma aethiopicum]
MCNPPLGKGCKLRSRTAATKQMTPLLPDVGSLERERMTSSPFDNRHAIPRLLLHLVLHLFVSSTSTGESLERCWAGRGEGGSSSTKTTIYRSEPAGTK